MRHPSEFGTAQVISDMKRYYGYNARLVHEVKGGTVGYAFCVDDKYLLKIYDKKLTITQRLTETLADQLDVLDKLHAHSLLKDRICFPIKNSDQTFFYEHDQLIGVLLSLIPGAALGFDNPYSDEDIRQLSTLVKDLHETDVTPFLGLCPVETYDLEFCHRLKHLLNADLPLLPQHFQSIISEFFDLIHQKIDQAFSLAETLKRSRLPYVLCHTDIHGGNIMRTPEGRLYLIDWENVILAPREADLFAFSEKKYFSAFCNPETIHPEALLYYIIRRDLEDIWEFLNGIVHNEYDDPGQAEVFSHVERILKHLCQPRVYKHDIRKEYGIWN